jgi:MFS family permease
MSTSWRGAGAAVVATGFGGAVPIPLLLLFRDELALSDAALTLAFGITAAGIVVGLLLAAPLSDRLGRRPVTVAATALGLAASLVLIAAQDSTLALYAGRLAQGLAGGFAFSAGTVWIAELSPPGAGPRNATVALSLGFGLGPLVAGLLGELSGRPLTWPFVVHAALSALAIAAALRTAESRPEGAARGIAIGIPHGLRRTFLLGLAPAALWVQGLPAIALATLPLMIDQTVGAVVLVTGATAAISGLAGALIQPAVRDLGTRALPLGLVVGLPGIAIGIAAVAVDERLLALPAAALLGAAYGMANTGGLARVAQIARPDQRAALTSSFLVASFAGYAGIPYLAVALRGPLGDEGALACLAALVGVALLVVRRPG